MAFAPRHRPCCPAGEKSRNQGVSLVPPSQFTVPDDLTLTSNAQNLLALKGTATPPAAIVFAPPSAVADASLSASTIAPSIDETNNALRIRAEYSNGTTLKTAIIPFQP